MERIQKPQIITPNISYQIWLIKIIAVFTIFFAHMPVSSKTLSLPDNYDWMVRLYAFLGMCGVPIFFFLSGFLFKKGKILKRVKSLFIPLIILGTLTYLIHSVNHGLEINLIDLGLWLIGSNCYLYFVLVLFWMIILYNIYPKDLFWIIVGFLSILLSHYKLIPYTEVFTVYNNPLNFIIYFACGHLIRKKGLWTKLENNIFVIVSIGIIVGSYFIKAFDSVSYFNIWSVFVNFSFIIISVYITQFQKKKHNKLILLGECTYVIYLIHMPIVGLVNKLLTPYLFGYFEVFKIIIAFLLVSITVFIGFRMLSYFKWNFLTKCLGYR